jgi:hypothetical protein
VEKPERVSDRLRRLPGSNFSPNECLQVVDADRIERSTSEEGSEMNVEQRFVGLDGRWLASQPTEMLDQVRPCFLDVHSTCGRWRYVDRELMKPALSFGAVKSASVRPTLRPDLPLDLAAVAIPLRIPGFTIGGVAPYEKMTGSWCSPCP